MSRLHVILGFLFLIFGMNIRLCGMTIRLCDGPHYFEMGLYKDFEIKQYGNEKKAQIKISFSLILKKKSPKKS
jgi:hypothetical protein